MGYFLAFLTAIFESFKDLSSKFNLKSIDEYTTAFSMQFVQTVLLLPLVFYFGFHELSLRFSIALISGSLIQLVVVLLYFKALKCTDLSLSVPLLTLTPLFMLVTSPIIIGEFPNLFGLISIVLVVIGTYILNLDGHKNDPWKPFTDIFKNKGQRYMFIVAFLWSLTANIDKIGVEESSPLFRAWSKDCLIMFLLMPMVYLKSSTPLRRIRYRAIPLTFAGIFRAGSVVSQMYAIQFVLVAYVIAIKRTSALLIIFWAFLSSKSASTSNPSW